MKYIQFKHVTDEKGYTHKFTVKHCSGSVLHVALFLFDFKLWHWNDLVA